LLSSILYFFHNMPDVINSWSVSMGPMVYVLLFLIIFCETGLLILPFLPGDSLLFALGALAAMNNSNLQISMLILILPLAALSGDFVNYNIGKFMGKKFLSSETGLLNRKHLHKTNAFYDRHGGKTIIFARFVPIVRTYAPFVAGVGQMKFTQFLSYSVVGAYAWIISVLCLGYFFGNIPTVKANFHYVIIAIIVLSVLPAGFEYFRSSRKVAS
jgi:membrane-associated protein